MVLITRCSTLIIAAYVLSSFAQQASGFVKPSVQRFCRAESSLFLFNFLKEGKKALVKKLAGDYDQAAVESRLDSLIRDNKVLMLSFTTCPYCRQAKGVLDNKKAKYTVVELNDDPQGTAIRAVLAEKVGRTSVPAMWINGEFIGGCNDGPGIVTLDQQGKLDPMLRAAGAI